MKPILKIFCVAAFISLTVQLAVAQNDRTAAVAAAGDKYLISAKAGGVNYVEGTVTLARKNGTSGRLLRRDEITVGDKVSTGDDGRAEILLNPGSYMRIGKNTEFEFKTTSLDDLQIRLNSGSALFEVFASNEFTVRVITPKAKFLLVESGVFRVDATTDGGAKISVLRGKALMADNVATLLKKGQFGFMKDGSSSVGKLNGEPSDDLEAWSKSRGKDLAKQTAMIKNPTVGNSLLSSFNRGMWGMYNSFGLWVWDPFRNSFCFLPFGSGWNSPYGYGYNNYIGGYHLPTTVYYPTVRTPPTPTERDARVLRVGSLNSAPTIPPFVRLQETPGNGGVTPRIGSNSPIETRGSNSGGDYSPSIRSIPSTVTTSSPVVSVPSAPAPTESGGSTRSPIKP